MGQIKCLEKAGAVASICTLVGGCQNLGAIAIDQGRDRYNSVLQSTAKVQTLANIVRVASHDSTSFIDVAEVDASTTLTGTGGGTVAGIGSKPASYGLLGTLTGGATYTEQPVVKYVPLTGSGLVAQVARPLTVDAIESLITSNWPTITVLDLTAFSISPYRRQSFAALNLIAELADDERALLLVAGKSDLTSTKQPSSGGSGSTGNPTNDTLKLFYRSSRDQKETRDEKINLRVLKQLNCLYDGTQAKQADQASPQTTNLTTSQDDTKITTQTNTKTDNQTTTQTNTQTNTQTKTQTKTQIDQFPPPSIKPSKSHAELAEAEVQPGYIELRTAPAALQNNIKNPIPLLKTYSGIGMLKNATEKPEPKISIVSREKYDKIHKHEWNTPDGGFYTLLIEDQNDDDNPKLKEGGEWAHYVPEVISSFNSAINDKLDSKTIQKHLMLYEPNTIHPVTCNNANFIYGNIVLGLLRRYILIIQDDFPPINAYVAYLYQGKWYYIDGEDEISKRNFNLVSLLLTVMSVPSATTPITTSISLGP